MADIELPVDDLRGASRAMARARCQDVGDGAGRLCWKQVCYLWLSRSRGNEYNI